MVERAVRQDRTEGVRAFEEIPYVTLPENYGTILGPFLSRMLQQHGPIIRTTYLEKPLVFLIGPEANEFVLSSAAPEFSHRAGWGELFGAMDIYGHGLVTMDGELHDYHRRLMVPAFRGSYMVRYLSVMDRIISERINSWSQGGSIDVYQEATTITFDIVATSLLGIEDETELDELRPLFKQLIIHGIRSRTSRRREMLAELLLARVRERHQNPKDDLLDLLVQARKDGQPSLTDDQIVAHIIVLLLAGHETSASLSAWFLHLLAQHPSYADRIRREVRDVVGDREKLVLQDLGRMSVLDNGLREAERLYPPVGVGPRGVVHDVVFNGYTIPGGCYVAYCIAATHLLPSIYRDPMTFNPDRFAPPRQEHRQVPYAHVPFGGGSRVCLGMAFARLEIKCLVSHVLRQYQVEPTPEHRAVQYYRALGIPLFGVKLHFRPTDGSVVS